MKKYFLISILLSLFAFGAGINQAQAQCGEGLIDVCHGKLGESKFLKSFPVQLAKQKKGDPLPVVKYTFVFNSGMTYRIYVCNAQEKPGKGIISLYHQDNMIGTTYMVDSKKHFPFIQFECKMSGAYSLSFYFEDGEEGCAMGVVSSLN